MKSDLCDVDVTLHHETEKALLISVTGDRDDAVWVANSMCELDRTGKIFQLTLPQWLATEKGLV